MRTIVLATILGLTAGSAFAQSSGETTAQPTAATPPAEATAPTTANATPVPMQKRTSSGYSGYSGCYKSTAQAPIS